MARRHRGPSERGRDGGTGGRDRGGGVHAESARHTQERREGTPEHDDHRRARTHAAGGVRAGARSGMTLRWYARWLSFALGWALVAAAAMAGVAWRGMV